MQTVSLKSNSPDTIIPILKTALDREKRIVIESLKIAKAKIERLCGELAVDPEKLMRGEVEHTENKDMKLVELEGELSIIKHLETELKELESVEICK